MKAMGSPTPYHSNRAVNGGGLDATQFESFLYERGWTI